MECKLMAASTIVISKDPRDKNLIDHVTKLNEEILWLPITGDIEPPPVGKWIDETILINIDAGFEIMRKVMFFANTWYLKNGKDITLIQDKFSLGDLICYHILEILPPLIKKAEILDMIKPNKVVCLLDQSHIMNLTKSWCDSRGIEIQIIKPSKIMKKQPNLGLKKISPSQKVKLKISGIIARLKQLLLPPPSVSKGILSLFNPASIRIRKEMGNIPKVHLILPLEMMKLSDYFNRRIHWAPRTMEIHPQSLSLNPLANIISKDPNVKKNFILNGIDFWPVIGKDIMDMISAWEGAIENASFKNGLFNILKNLNIQYYFTGQDFAWEERLIALWCKTKDICSFHVQHGAFTRKAYLFNDCLPKSRCQKALIWTKCAKSIFSIMGFSEKDIIVWGNPKIYSYKEISRNKNLREKTRNNIGIKPDENVVLLLPSIYVSLYGFSDSRRVNLEFREICKGFKKVSQIRLMIRYHPSLSHYEDIRYKRDIARKYGPPNLIEDPGLSLLESLSCADAVMGGNSTVMVEALAMNKIVFECASYGDFLGIAESKAGLSFNPDEISVERVLKQYINLSDSFKKDLENNRRIYLNEMVESPSIDIEDVLNH